MAMVNPERLISPQNISEVSEQNRVVVCSWTTEGPWDFRNDKIQGPKTLSSQNWLEKLFTPIFRLTFTLDFTVLLSLRQITSLDSVLDVRAELENWHFVSCLCLFFYVLKHISGLSSCLEK